MGCGDVIDGLQRLSTIFEFAGILKDENGEELPPLTLRRTKYLPSMDGRKWDADDPAVSIGNTNQLIIRRSKIDIKIILRESSESSKYELFQRLNTGGSQLSDQEVRNVILLMVNPDAYRWIERLAQDENFQTCIALSDRMLSERYDLELVTRFLVFRNLEENKLGSVEDIGNFLTDKISNIAQSDDFQETREAEEAAFKDTFTWLANSLEERSFRRYDAGKDRHLGGFLISAFEPIAFGIGHNVGSYNSSTDTRKIEEAVKELWATSEFTNRSGGGVRATTRLRSTIPLGRRLFAL